MRVLITGGAGFIGANLARMLDAEQDPPELRVIDDLSTGDRSSLDGTSACLTLASILDTEALAEAADGVDAIVHLAAIPSVPLSLVDPRTSHEVNATGTLNVLEVARERGAQVIVASSSAVYGANHRLPQREDDWTRPLSPYGVGKLATEGYALAWQASFGLPTLAFRLFNVYGPGQSADHAYAAVIPQFLDAALAGRPVTVHGDGNQTRDFTFVGTVSSVISAAIRRRVSHPGPVNLAYGSNISVLELLDVIGAELGAPVPREFSAGRVGDVKFSQADGTLLGSLFPEMSPVGLNEGLRATIDWFTSRAARSTP